MKQKRISIFELKIHFENIFKFHPLKMANCFMIECGFYQNVTNNVAHDMDTLVHTVLNTLVDKCYLDYISK